MDSDVYKWLEAASLGTARLLSETLRAAIDTTIALVEAAQGDDGYLNSSCYHRSRNRAAGGPTSRGATSSTARA
jgi:DUF1680 family protein